MAGSTAAASTDRAFLKKYLVVHIPKLGKPEHFDLRDPVALSQVQGREGISIPYSFDLTMLRDENKPDLDPHTMIGAFVRFGVLIKDKDTYAYRSGLIEHFEKSGRSHLRHRRVYGVRIVSPFQLLGRETRFRVFENVTVTQVLDEVLGEMKTRLPAADYDLSKIKSLTFPQMEYCVQFGETTFGFVSRLLQRFGLVYYFDNRKDKGWAPEGESENQTLFIAPAMAAGFKEIDATFTASDDPDKENIGRISHQFNAVFRKIKTGAFNILDPKTPIVATRPINAIYDFCEGDGGSKEAGLAGALRRTDFPAPIEKNPDPPEDQPATDYADAQITQQEQRAAVVTGTTNSGMIFAARQFKIEKDETKLDEANHVYLLRGVFLCGFEASYEASAGEDVLDYFKELFARATGADNLSPTMTQAVTDMNMYLASDPQTGATHQVGQTPGGALPSPSLGSSSTISGALGTIATALSWIGGLIPAVTDIVQRLMAFNSGEVSTAFVAVPQQANGALYVRPDASVARPLAAGPHLALVIGNQGLTAPGGNDIYADALGRVRIRFPWDPGPPLPPGTEEDPNAKWANDTRTCWVRVSEGWAGHRSGTQFLPRIGDEVIVQFLGGDPERPIVTGRVYNATGAKTNLPFFSVEQGGTEINAKSLHQPQLGQQYTRSGIKTRSTPKPDGGKEGFHLLRLDDKFGSEQYLLRSQGRTDFTTLKSRHDTTHGSAHEIVGGGPPQPPETIGGGKFVTVGGEYDLHVRLKRYATMNDDWYNTADGNVVFSSHKQVFVSADTFMTLTGPDILLKASKKISLVVGSSTIVVAPGGVYINGAEVKINSGGPPPGSIGALDVPTAVDAAQADPGDPPDWLAKQPKGGGGKRGSFHVPSFDAPAVAMTKDGKMQVGGPKSNVLVDAKDPAYANNVIDDISKNSGDPAMQNLMNGGGQPVTITKPPANGQPGTPQTIAGTDPANATQAGQPTGRTGADGKPEVGTGKGAPTVITHDPAQYKASNDPNAPKSDQALLGALQDANENGQGQVPGNSFGP
jgi:uncharacterized protein involved in type VI secretion and phage assembly